MFSPSEKAEWQKKNDTFTELKNKLEEEKLADAVKIEGFKVSPNNKCFKG